MATNKLGPLESLILKNYCEMCGARSRRAVLEPAFNPSAEPKTLCRDCRIGSAELLAARDAKPYALVVIRGGVGYVAIADGVDCDVLDCDNLNVQSASDTSLSQREWDYLRVSDPDLYFQLTHDACDCRERSWYGPGHDTACPQNTENAAPSIEN